MKCTDEIAADMLVLSQPKKSRRSTEIKYVYVTLDDENVTVETPKLKVSDVHLVDEKISINLDLQSEAAKPMSDFIDRFYASLLDCCWSSDTNARNVEMHSEVRKTFLPLKINGQGKAEKTMFFDNESRKLMTEGLTTICKQLTATSVKVIAKLDGIILDDSLHTIRPVWSVDQALLFKEAPANPFGNRYCFIEDDDGYLSLED